MSDKKRKNYNEGPGNPIMRVNRKNMGAALKYNRKMKGLGQMDLMYISGVQSYVISSIERGKGNPQMETLSKLFSAMDMTMFDGIETYLDFIRRGL